MNGFLNNLMSRTLSTGNLVEPRLPSLFEPLPIEAGTPLEEAHSVEALPAPHAGRYDSGSVTEDEMPRAARPQSHSKQRDDLIADDSGDVDGEKKRQTRSVRIAEAPVDPNSGEQGIAVDALRPSFRVRPRTKSLEQSENAQSGDEFGAALPQIETEYSATTLRVPSERDSSRTPISSSAVDETEAKVSPRVEDPFSGEENFAETSPSLPIAAELPQPRHSLPRLQPISPADLFQTEVSFGLVMPDRSQSAEHGPIKTRLPEFDPAVVRPETERRTPSQSNTDARRQNRVGKLLKATVNPWRDPPPHSRRAQQFGVKDPQPAINVTIGRVEVRAVQAVNAKATPSRQTESPVMPLEEYLRKQRRGGER